MEVSALINEARTNCGILIPFIVFNLGASHISVLLSDECL